MSITELLPLRFEKPHVFDLTTLKKLLPQEAGVYAVIRNDEVLYVGYTSNLRSRFTSHGTVRVNRIYTGDIYFWPNLNPADETVAMVCLKPKYNKQISRVERGFEGNAYWNEIVTLLKQHKDS